MMRTKVAAVAVLAFAVTGCSTVELQSDALLGLMGSPPTGDRIALARIKEKQGDIAAADKMYREVHDQNPADPEPLHRLAVLKTREGHLSEAESTFRQALQLGTPTTQLLSDYAYHSYLAGEVSRAEQYCRQALARDADYKVAWTNLGLALGAQDRFDEAREAFLEAASSPADAHCDLAFALVHRGRFEQARREYDQALALDPHHPVAGEGLLQVSRRVPGSHPITVVRTVGQPLPPPTEDHMQPQQREGWPGGPWTPGGPIAPVPISPAIDPAA